MGCASNRASKSIWLANITETRLCCISLDLSISKACMKALHLCIPYPCILKSAMTAKSAVLYRCFYAMKPHLRWTTRASELCSLPWSAWGRGEPPSLWPTGSPPSSTQTRLQVHPVSFSQTSLHFGMRPALQFCPLASMGELALCAVYALHNE